MDKKQRQAEREALLHRLWAAHVERLVEALENTPAGDLKAALLNVTRQTLSDNGITLDTLSKEAAGDIASGLADKLKRAVEQSQADPVETPEATPSVQQDATPLPPPEWEREKVPG